MNTEGTDVGPQVIRLLEEGLAQYMVNPSNVTLVVAPGYCPDFPSQSESYAAMMGRWLRKNGCQKVVELEAKSFDTDGEMREFYDWCIDNTTSKDEMGICGISWHLKRTYAIAWIIDRQWAHLLKWYPVEEPMSDFDHRIERIKWVKVFLPKRLHRLAVGTYKLLFSKRTSY